MCPTAEKARGKSLNLCNLCKKNVKFDKVFLNLVCYVPGETQEASNEKKIAINNSKWSSLAHGENAVQERKKLGNRRGDDNIIIEY